MSAIYKFVGRRGLQVKMLSDRGTNFIGTSRELKELVTKLDKDQIIRQTSDNRIQWDLNPPIAPHWGCAHEIMIKAAKRAVYAILRNADVRDEELIVRAESLINSRSLTYQSASPEDIQPLTSNHYLFGQMGGCLLQNLSSQPRLTYEIVGEGFKN